VSQFFATIAEADLGDEGRLPPDLSDVGAKLNPLWMHQVLTESAVARPYMGTRMPQYGAANVQPLPGAFACAAGVFSTPDHGPVLPREYAAVGRDLVGAKALNCIQCHTVSGHDATGTPGPDLAVMTDRLRYDSFARWLHDPSRVRPGTRMPSFFVDGRGAFTDFLEGDAEKQVQAIWAYLSQGEFLPLPEGLIAAGGLELAVTDRPIVVRTFMKQAGVRAIACGFPEQIHCAFDAEKCGLVAIWQGPFLNAKGAWAGRGGNETNPQHVVWSTEHPTIELEDRSAARRFRGYRLDERGLPTFMYDVVAGAVTVVVREQPMPGKSVQARALVRRFEIEGPPQTMLLIRTAGARPKEAIATKDGGTLQLKLDANGRASFELEHTW
jgi:hypothetical protein